MTSNASSELNNVFTTYSNPTNTVITLTGIGANNSYTFTVASQSLAGGQTTYTYYPGTLSGVLPAFAADINSDAQMQALGITATATASTMTITDRPTYSVSTTGSTEVVKNVPGFEGTNSIAFGGTPTVGDTITLQTSFAPLPGGVENTSYTVASGDTIATIASKLAAAFNGDTKFQNIGLNAELNPAAQQPASNRFYGSNLIGAGLNSSVVSGVDGGGSTTSNNYILTNNPARIQYSSAVSSGATETVRR